MKLLLEKHLEPLKPFLTDPSIGDICINRPGQVYVQSHADLSALGMTAHSVPELEMNYLYNTCHLIASATMGQEFVPDHPIFSAVLETGERIEVVGYDNIAPNTISISIRKPPSEVDIDALEERGLFDRGAALAYHGEKSDSFDLLSKRDWKSPQEIIRAFVDVRANIAFSGQTGTYKSSLARYTMSCGPSWLRYISIEDSLELIDPSHDNRVSMLVSRGQLSASDVTMSDALRSAMRQYGDSIFLGEVRGEEAIVLYELMASGHPLTVSTVHAKSCEAALHKLSRLANVSYSDMAQELDLIVQLTRQGNRKFVSEVICVMTDIDEHGEVCISLNRLWP